MDRQPIIFAEPNAVPIVRVVAILLENALRHSSIANMMGELEGILSLKSTIDHQTVSIHFNLGEIKVTKGVAPDAILTAELDLNWPIILGPDIKLEGALQHAHFATAIQQIFAQHPTDWREAAQIFWSRYGSRVDLPPAMRVQCSDDDGEIILGKGNVEMHLIGSNSALSDIFTCSAMLVRSVITGEIHAIGKLKYLSTLSGVYFDRMTGEIP